MFSLFSQNKKALEEEKIEKLEKSQEMPKKPPAEDPLMNFDRIKKSEIEKQILLKRRREPNISAELLETSYKKRLTSPKIIQIISYLFYFGCKRHEQGHFSEDFSPGKQ